MAIEINGDTGISGVNGSATTPAIQGTDTNTGLSFGTDEVNIVTGGSTRATMDASGEFGIGTTTPDAPLHVYKAGDGQTPVHFQTGNGNGHLYFYNDSDGFSIDSGGDLRFVTNRSASGTPTRFKFQNDGRMLYGTEGSISDCRINLKGDFGNNRGVCIETNQSSADMVLLRTSSGHAGIISSSGTSTTYGTSSDYRLKENITLVTDGITRLQQLQPKRFNFLAEPSKTVDGFIAHEVQAVVPEAITGEKDGIEVWREGQELPDGVSVGDNKLDEDGNTIPVYQCIDQSKLVPLLTAALQEAIGKIETLEIRVAQLEGGTN